MTENKQKRTKKHKKKPNPVLDYMLYLLTRVVAIFVQMMKTDDSVRLAKNLGDGLYKIYQRGRKRAIENLQRSFPDKDNKWIEKTAKQSFEHIVMLAFDVLRTGRLISPTTWHKYVELGEIAEPLRLMLEKRSVIMVTGHYGNFEVLGYALATFGLPSYSIARPIDNPYINRYLLGVRQRRGQIIIDKKGATEQILDILERGATIGFIADQNAGKKGVFVPFFGRKASTYKSIALLAMEYNLPIVVGYCRRIDNRYKFKIGLTRIIQPHEWENKGNPLKWITEEYTKGIEEFIREEPGQYWWVHRRWKTRPPEERKINKQQRVAN